MSNHKGHQSRTRILHFPANHSLGSLYRLHTVTPGATRGTSRVVGRQRVHEARGTVIIAGDDNLELWYTGGEQADLSPLAQFQPDDLYQLTLAFCNVGDRSLIQGLLALECLTLHDTRISDAGVAHLQGLIKLEKLWLGSTMITDRGLAHLSGLTALKELYLADTSVTDAGLVHLSQLMSLEWLYLSSNNVSPEGVTSLQQALPCCAIDVEMDREDDEG